MQALLHLILAALSVNAALRPYFTLSPKDSQISKRLSIGFEEGLVGTANLPIALLDGHYQKSYDSVEGRMKYLPWSRFFLEDFLFPDSLLELHRLKVDFGIYAKTDDYYPKAEKSSRRLAFLTYRFSARFIETFLSYERHLDVPVTRLSDDTPSVSLDLMTQMYHFFYCEALAYIGRTDDDPFNRCPNPCKATRVKGKSDKCPTGGRGCNPCLTLGVEGRLNNRTCQQLSRVWRNDFQCHCGAGFVWNRDKQTCLATKNLVEPLKLRKELKISIDSLNLFTDSGLPKLVGGFQTATGFKEFDIDPEKRFHPFGHESYAQLKTKQRMTLDFTKHGTPGAEPQPIIIANLPNPTIVERLHATYTVDECTVRLVRTTSDLPPSEPSSVASTMTVAACMQLCEMDATCTYLVMTLVETRGNDRVHCYMTNLFYPTDGQKSAPNFVQSDYKCSWKDGIEKLCWAMHKTCNYRPPRMLVSEKDRQTVRTVSNDPRWQDVLSADVCVDESTLNRTYAIPESMRLATGDYAECVVHCQAQCASSMFLSTKGCLCAAAALQSYLSHGGGVPCGAPCPHRADWTCGGNKLFKGFVLPLTSVCAKSPLSATVLCLKLLSTMHYDGRANEEEQEKHFLETLSAPHTVPLKDYLSTQVYGPYYSNSKSAKLRSSHEDDPFLSAGSVFSSEVVKVELRSHGALECQTFCQVSCMRYFALSVAMCYCTNRIELIADTSGAGFCSSLVRVTDGSKPKFLTIGLDQTSASVYDMGYMSPAMCTRIAQNSWRSIPHTWEPNFPETLALITTGKVTPNMYIGCFIMAAETTPGVERSQAPSIDVCAHVCGAKCYQYSHMWGLHCSCSNEPPTEDKRYLQSLDDTMDLCPFGIGMFNISRFFTVRTSNAAAGIAGYGSTFSFSSTTKRLYHRGCHAFQGSKFGPGMAVVTYFLFTFFNDFQIVHRCSERCSSNVCATYGYCDFGFIVCGPDTCGMTPFCLCLLTGAAFSRVKKVSSKLCAEDNNAGAAAHDNVRLARLKHTQPADVFDGLNRARDKFLKQSNYFTPEGGMIFVPGRLLPTPYSSFASYKTVKYQHCMLRETDNGMVAAAVDLTAGSHCYAVPSRANRREITWTRARSHGECYDMCRHQCKGYYMLLHTGSACVCFDHLNNFGAAVNDRNCQSELQRCSGNEVERLCGGPTYAHGYRIKAPLSCSSVLCQPQFLSQEGFFNLSVLYHCPHGLDAARVVALVPADGRTKLTTETGLFGLTKVDIHRGPVHLPVLTKDASASVRYQLKGLLSGVYESGFTRADDAQMRARYAQWDTELRVVHQRTFNATLSLCNRDTSIKLIVGATNQPALCVCRDDYQGIHCNSYRKGCDYIGGNTRAVQLGQAACNVLSSVSKKSRNVCYSAAEVGPPVKPNIDYSCACKGEFQRDYSLDFDNCFQENSACSKVNCGLGICTDTFDEAKGWHCICKTGSVRTTDGTCKQMDPIYLFTSWSDWGACEPECGPRRQRVITRRCLLPGGQAACALATPDSETQRQRICRPRACTRHLGQAALQDYEQRTGDTLDLASGTVALLAVSMATSVACGLFIAIAWVISPSMGRRILEESLWFFLVARNRLARIFLLPMLPLMRLYANRRHAATDVEEKKVEKKVEKKPEKKAEKKVEKKGEKKAEKVEKKTGKKVMKVAEKKKTK